MIRVTIIRQGSDESAEVKEFLAAQINIGRVERNDLVLANSRVSSVHARAIEAEAGITLIDNNSTNGTFVNGALVRGPVTVDPEDSVEIGSFTLHFERVHVDEVLEDVSEIAPSEFEEFPQEESTEPVEVSTTVELFDHGPPVEIELPAAGDVTEIDPADLWGD